eukprot:1152751-Pelagomonas_calceolata.AAC.5
MGMSAFENKVLLILHIILGYKGFTMVAYSPRLWLMAAGRENSIIPRGLLNFQGMDTKAKSSHTADDVFRLGWESTPVM